MSRNIVGDFKYCGRNCKPICSKELDEGRLASLQEKYFIEWVYWSKKYWSIGPILLDHNLIFFGML